MFSGGEIYGCHCGMSSLLLCVTPMHPWRRLCVLGRLAAFNLKVKYPVYNRVNAVIIYSWYDNFVSLFFIRNSYGNSSYYSNFIIQDRSFFTCNLLLFSIIDSLQLPVITDMIVWFLYDTVESVAVVILWILSKYIRTVAVYVFSFAGYNFFKTKNIRNQKIKRDKLTIVRKNFIAYSSNGTNYTKINKCELYIYCMKI